MISKYYKIFILTSFSLSAFFLILFFPFEGFLIVGTLSLLIGAITIGIVSIKRQSAIEIPVKRQYIPISPYKKHNLALKKVVPKEVDILGRKSIVESILLEQEGKKLIEKIEILQGIIQKIHDNYKSDLIDEDIYLKSIEPVKNELLNLLDHFNVNNNT